MKKFFSVLIIVFFTLIFMTIALGGTKLSADSLLTMAENSTNIKLQDFKIKGIASQISDSRLKDDFTTNKSNKVLVNQYVDYAQALNNKVSMENEFIRKALCIIIDIDYLNSQNDYLSGRISNYSPLVDAENQLYKTGGSDKKTHQSMEKQLNDLKNSLSDVESNIIQKNKEFEALTGEKISKGADYSDAYLILDMAIAEKQNIVTKTFESSAFSDTDDAGLLPLVPDVAADISDSESKFKNLGNALKDYISADENYKAAQDAVKTMSISKDDFNNAKFLYEDAQNNVVKLKADYAKSLLLLDSQFQGNLSKSLGKAKNSFFTNIDTSTSTFSDGLITYPWTDSNSGRYFLYGQSDKDSTNKVYFKIMDIPMSDNYKAEDIGFYEIQYGEQSVVPMTEIDKASSFDKVKLGSSSFFKVDFFDKDKKEIGSYYIDGFAPIGQFFLIATID